MTDDTKTLQDLHDNAVSQIMKLTAELSGKDPALAYSLLVSAEQQVRFALVNNLSQNIGALQDKKVEEAAKKDDGALVQQTRFKGDPFLQTLTAQIVPTSPHNIIKGELDIKTGTFVLREYKGPTTMKAGNHEQ